MPRLLYDIPTVAEVLSLPIGTVSALIEAGHLRAMDIGNCRLVHRGELLRFASPAAPDVD